MTGLADAVVTDGIEILVTEVQLFSREIEEKVEALQTDDAKASETEHAIRHEITVRVEETPAFYQSLRERLEAIIEERRQQRLDAADQLTLLINLRDELAGEQTQAPDIGLDARGRRGRGRVPGAAHTGWRLRSRMPPTDRTRTLRSHDRGRKPPGRHARR